MIDDDCDEEREDLHQRYGYPLDFVLGLSASVADHLLSMHVVDETRKSFGPFSARRAARKIAATYERQAALRSSS